MKFTKDSQLQNTRLYLKRFEGVFFDQASEQLKALLLLVHPDKNSPFAEKLNRSLTYSKGWILKEDLMTVFLKLCVLQIDKTATLSAQQFTLLLKRLISCETETGGLYRERTGEVLYDSNLVVAYFLHSVDALPRPLRQYLKSTEEVPVYLGGAVAKTFLKQVLSTSAQEVGLQDLLSETLRGATKQLSISSLLKSQTAEGTWRGQILAENSTAFLNTYSTTVLVSTFIDQKITQHPHPASDSIYEITARKVFRRVKKDLQVYEDPLRKSLAKVLNEVQRADTHYEIFTISYMFANSLKQVVDSDLLSYSEANVYLWMSYTIYDDFLDNEGDPALLPTANICMRSSLETYRLSLQSKAQYAQIVLGAYDSMDQANAWEVQKCRFDIFDSHITLSTLPDYKNLQILAERAAGHIAGPLLVINQISSSLSQRRSLKKGLDQYLIARQLNDDIHDWKDDLKNGRITHVVCELLMGVGAPAKTYELDDLIQQLEVYFWERGFLKITNKISIHCLSAASNLTRSGLMKPRSDFFDLITRIEASNQKSIERYALEREFLKEYKTTHAS